MLDASLPCVSRTQRPREGCCSHSLCWDNLGNWTGRRRGYGSFQREEEEEVPIPQRPELPNHSPALVFLHLVLSTQEILNL